jgi:hypothetical protein
MSDENRWKWNEFVEIGNTIQKMVGKELKTRKAKAALLLSDALMNERNTFIIDSQERYELYETLLPKIAEYLDGNAEVIQSAVKDPFSFNTLKQVSMKVSLKLHSLQRKAASNWNHL